MECDTSSERKLVLAFDDSGGIERLCRWNGDPIPGDHPIVLLAGFYLDREAEEGFAEADRLYLKDPRFRRELARIRGHSRKLFDGCHRLITSPLLHLYVLSLASANELTRSTGRLSETDILVDPFGDSHGIDAAETVETIKDIASLGHIGAVHRVENADELPSFRLPTSSAIAHSGSRWRNSVTYGLMNACSDSSGTGKDRRCLGPTSSTSCEDATATCNRW